MIKTVVMLSVLLLGGAVPAAACPGHVPSGRLAPPRGVVVRVARLHGDSYDQLDLGDRVGDDEILAAVYLSDQQVGMTATRDWMRSLASGLMALLALAAVAICLSRLTLARRPLAATVIGRRPVPAPVVLSLLSPMLPPLVLMHAEHEVIPSPVMLLALVGAVLAASMLVARRRLGTQLRWASSSLHGGDGTLVAAEVSAKKLVPPTDARGRVPWFMADLLAAPTEAATGESARVALGQASVDARTATLLHRLANEGAAIDEPLTILGTITRVPADAAAADPLCREVPMQARIGRTPWGRALVIAGTPADLARRLRVECAVLGALLGLCLGAAALACF